MDAQAVHANELEDRICTMDKKLSPSLRDAYGCTDCAALVFPGKRTIQEGGFGVFNHFIKTKVKLLSTEHKAKVLSDLALPYPLARATSCTTTDSTKLTPSPNVRAESEG
eukprot:scaffold338_cov377-Prasinococcus_capsulatus_cf.AAC.17